MATKTIAWTTGSGNITLTYTGQGNGSIVVSSDVNKGAARSQTITIKTTQGGVKTKNITVSQAACPFPVGDIKNYSYTGSVQSVLLPAGSYKLQCWGAQGGSNSADSTYGITAQAGGKGGYSEGVLTLSQNTTVYIFVGGKGNSSGNGGWNGGGGGSGTSSYNSGGENGISSFGCGGGATDIALTTSSMSYSSYRNNRSSASLLSRMIVAGGGSGGAYGYQEITTETETWQLVDTVDCSSWTNWWWSGQNRYARSYDNVNWLEPNTTYRFKATSGTTPDEYVIDIPGSSYDQWTDDGVEVTTYDTSYSNNTFHLLFYNKGESCTFTVEKKVTSSSTTTDSESQIGYVGGGSTGGGYSNTYKGRQNGAGTNGSFGLGANQTVSNYRYAGGCGGGGWYGGGNKYSDSNLSNIRVSGGGSGFVNTAASAGNRPSGYTGLQLDSGSTTAGNSSFPAPGGGNETGHAGNGYARITRLS